MNKALPILLVVLLSTISVHSQVNRRMKKDHLELACVLQGQTIKAKEKAVFSNQDEELNVFLLSATDSVVKAPVDLTVTTIKRTEEGAYELVAHHDDYWIWFTGIEKVSVTKQQKLLKGQPLGTMQPGHALELLLYDFETPLDPVKYIRCP